MGETTTRGSCCYRSFSSSIDVAMLVARPPRRNSGNSGSRDSESAHRKEQRKVEKKRSERPQASPFRRMKVIGESQLAPSISRARARARTRSSRSTHRARCWRCCCTVRTLICERRARAHGENRCTRRTAQPRDFT